MEILKTAIMSLLLILLATCQEPIKEVAASPPEEPRPVLKENPYLKQLLVEYQHFIDSTLEATGTPGVSVAVVKDTSIIYLKGFGLRSSEGVDSVDVNTVFRIGSVSKSLASFLTGIMVEEGTLKWQDKVVAHLPDFKLKSEEHTNALNLNHVLSHTTGLPYHTYTTLVEDHKELGDMLVKLSQIKLIGEPGQLYSYQNVAYSLIDPVMNAATGKSFAQQMQEQVFEPLQMKDASLSYDGMINHPNIALPHEQGVPTKITTTYYNVAPAGGVNASITDMAQWLTALNGQRPEIISKATLGQLFRPLVKTPVRNRYFGRWTQIKKAYYGLGFRILDYNNELVAYHGGYVNGYRCEVAVYPKAGLAICIMANAATELSNQSVPAFLNLYQEHRSSIEYWEAQVGAHQQLSLQKEF